MKDKIDRYRDEKVIARVVTAGLSAYIWIPIAIALFITPLHEVLHIIGALAEGAQIGQVNILIVENWIQQYLFLQPTGPVGMVEALFPQNASGFLFLPPTAMYYFLPYVVMFPLSLFLIAGDNVDISNSWRVIGAPMFYATFIAFWHDYALYQGIESATIPLPAFVVQALYISVIMVGITGTTWYAILKSID